LGENIVKLAVKLGIDPDTVQLARIYIPPYIRVKDGKRENVDGYWKQGSFASLTPEEKKAVNQGATPTKKTPSKAKGVTANDGGVVLKGKQYSLEDVKNFQQARDIGAKRNLGTPLSMEESQKVIAEYQAFVEGKKNKRMLKEFFTEGTYTSKDRWTKLPGDGSSSGTPKNAAPDTKASAGTPEVPGAPQPSEEFTPPVTEKNADWTSADSEWWKNSDAPSASDVQKYVAANGPYMYHGTGKAEYADSMLKEGIKSPKDLGWSDAELEQGYNSDEPFMAEGVYLGSLSRAQEFAGNKGGGMVRIDIRKLDPSKVGDVIDDSYSGVSAWDIEIDGSIPGSVLELVDPKTGEPY